MTLQKKMRNDVPIGIGNTEENWSSSWLINRKMKKKKKYKPKVDQLQVAFQEIVSYGDCKYNILLENSVMILGIGKMSFVEWCIFWSLELRKEVNSERCRYG